MSAVMASSTETETIFVRLLEEGTDVWRPVPAHRLSETTYRLADTQVPEDEIWRFHPGDIVVAEHRLKGGQRTVERFAVARASDFDGLPHADFSLAS
jgi:hypothetical protein